MSNRRNTSSEVLQVALMNLEQFEKDWPQYPRIGEMMRRNWVRVATMFSYEGDIRRVIYYNQCHRIGQ